MGVLGTLHQLGLYFTLDSPVNIIRPCIMCDIPWQREEYIRTKAPIWYLWSCVAAVANRFVIHIFYCPHQDTIYTVFEFFQICSPLYFHCPHFGCVFYDSYPTFCFLSILHQFFIVFCGIYIFFDDSAPYYVEKYIYPRRRLFKFILKARNKLIFCFCLNFLQIIFKIFFEKLRLFYSFSFRNSGTEKIRELF